MKKRKTLAMGLAVAMAVSCLAGCGGDDKKASSDGKTEQVLNISNNSPHEQRCEVERWNESNCK